MPKSSRISRGKLCGNRHGEEAARFHQEWASLNTFSAASGDFAKATAAFLPLLPTTSRKAKMTVICGNFPLHGIILAIFQNVKNGRKKTGNLFLISCFSVPVVCMAVIQFFASGNSTNINLSVYN
ncbi:hypothetical protein [Schaedlerella arabinosiphila]|uniref:hypothetical protein n=1 Tax=Schaedlerella arabinosiphila TaxID=2044587 RepID=UPI0011CFB6D3|nr:hypothetical protein [Schaedlerella arabinosiphila]